ncbi:PREDICTED: uncharacterized protein LOC105951080 [Erythranthe guttata]|uniref:uncharacterized protein LOC105951080 n=1 Tax=Erythranthe guttata TaxID=4155 RepID=UPI00064DF421|nr:PREDICTED: uncharacterized protein LOC105951080 [Erythranthe guttata]|eukprot:XP_012829927.1 PREDICTED: uncharacterized protein LOC105951080 [Erythranthe guttata]
MGLSVITSDRQFADVFVPCRFSKGRCFSLKMGYTTHQTSTSSTANAGVRPVVVSGVDGVKVSSSSSVEEFSFTATSSDKDDELKITVEVSGTKTQEIYDQFFAKMVEDAQPIPGFRKVKGGKTPNIPKEILLEILGPSRVYHQVIKKVINIAVAKYVAKEGLKVGKELEIFKWNSDKKLSEKHKDKSRKHDNSSIVSFLLNSICPEKCLYMSAGKTTLWDCSSATKLRSLMVVLSGACTLNNKRGRSFWRDGLSRTNHFLSRSRKLTTKTFPIISYSDNVNGGGYVDDGGKGSDCGRVSPAAALHQGIARENDGGSETKTNKGYGEDREVTLRRRCQTGSVAVERACMFI